MLSRGTCVLGKLTTEVEKEKHASPSFRATCFMYLTPACDRLTDGRKDQQNEDIEGVAALLKALRYRDVDCEGVAARYALRSLARTLQRNAPLVCF